MTNPNPRLARGLGKVCRSEWVGTPNKYLARPAAAIPCTSVRP
jgi:hypothetical protein